jgi:hypothetical protein
LPELCGSPTLLSTHYQSILPDSKQLPRQSHLPVLFPNPLSWDSVENYREQYLCSIVFNHLTQFKMQRICFQILNKEQKYKPHGFKHLSFWEGGPSSALKGDWVEARGIPPWPQKQRCSVGNRPKASTTEVGKTGALNGGTL